MRIEPSPPDEGGYRARRRDVAGFLRELASDDPRPCPGCDVPCPCRSSPTCTCRCSSACPYAPARMSCEPETQPVEAGIVPLVYSLYALRLCRPCWSCEGHYDVSGELGKLPSVWFHCHSTVYPALIAEALFELRFRKAVTHPWQVAVVSLGNRLDTTFAIEPDLAHTSLPPLAALHRDVAAISAALVDEVRKIGALTLREIDEALARMAGMRAVHPLAR